MSQAVAEKILEKGARLVWEKGFNNTGLNDILQAAEIPRGSFYYYFKSKEDFGLKLIEYLHSGIGNAFSRYLSEESDTPPLERLRSIFEYFRKAFMSDEQKCGCPIGNISQEMAATNSRFREKLHAVFQDIMDPVSLCLDRAVEAGDLHSGTDTAELAEFIINSWQGALIYLKVADCERPLVLFEKYIFDKLLPCCATESRYVR
jgi:TetR/AcrR family transcriptional repressor of nem operon